MPDYRIRKRSAVTGELFEFAVRAPTKQEAERVAEQGIAVIEEKQTERKQPQLPRVLTGEAARTIRREEPQRNVAARAKLKPEPPAAPQQVPKFRPADWRPTIPERTVADLNRSRPPATLFLEGGKAEEEPSALQKILAEVMTARPIAGMPLTTEQLLELGMRTVDPIFRQTQRFIGAPVAGAYEAERARLARMHEGGPGTQEGSRLLDFLRGAGEHLVKPVPPYISEMVPEAPWYQTMPLEVLGDPTTYMGLGTLKAGARAAAKLFRTGAKAGETAGLLKGMPELRALPSVRRVSPDVYPEAQKALPGPKTRPQAEIAEAVPPPHEAVRERPSLPEPREPAAAAQPPESTEVSDVLAMGGKELRLPQTFMRQAKELWSEGAGPAPEGRMAGKQWVGKITESQRRELLKRAGREIAEYRADPRRYLEGAPKSVYQGALRIMDLLGGEDAAKVVTEGELPKLPALQKEALGADVVSPASMEQPVPGPPEERAIGPTGPPKGRAVAMPEAKSAAGFQERVRSTKEELKLAKERGDNDRAGVLKRKLKASRNARLDEISDALAERRNRLREVAAQPGGALSAEAERLTAEIAQLEGEYADIFPRVYGSKLIDRSTLAEVRTRGDRAKQGKFLGPMSWGNSLSYSQFVKLTEQKTAQLRKGADIGFSETAKFQDSVLTQRLVERGEENLRAELEAVRKRWAELQDKKYSLPIQKETYELHDKLDKEIQDLAEEELYLRSQVEHAKGAVETAAKAPDVGVPDIPEPPKAERAPVADVDTEGLEQPPGYLDDSVEDLLEELKEIDLEIGEDHPHIAAKREAKVSIFHRLNAALRSEALRDRSPTVLDQELDALKASLENRFERIGNAGTREEIQRELFAALDEIDEAAKGFPKREMGAQLPFGKGEARLGISERPILEPEKTGGKMGKEAGAADIAAIVGAPLAVVHDVARLADKYVGAPVVQSVMKLLTWAGKKATPEEARNWVKNSVRYLGGKFQGRKGVVTDDLQQAVAMQIEEARQGEITAAYLSKRLAQAGEKASPEERKVLYDAIHGDPAAISKLHTQELRETVEEFRRVMDDPNVGVAAELVRVGAISPEVFTMRHSPEALAEGHGYVRRLFEPRLRSAYEPKTVIEGGSARTGALKRRRDRFILMRTNVPKGTNPVVWQSKPIKYGGDFAIEHAEAIDAYKTNVSQRVHEILQANPDMELKDAVDAAEKAFKLVAPISDEKLQKLGLITDPAFLVGRTILDSTSDLAKLKFFARVAAMTDDAGKPKYVMSVLDAPQGWVKVPSGREWGVLAGKAIHPHAWDAVRTYVDMRGAVGKFADRALSYFKWYKTVASPATHVRNFVSNLVFTMLADTSPTDIRNIPYYFKAIKTLSAGPTDRLHRYMILDGVIGSDFYTAEVRTSLNALLARMGTDPTSERPFTELLRQKVFATKDWLEKGANSAYQMEDIIYKAAAYRKAFEDSYRKAIASGARETAAREAGRQAGKAIVDWFPDYGRWQGPWAQQTRRFFMPFGSFTVEATRIGAKALRERPLTLAAIVAGLAYICKESRIRNGITDELWEKIVHDQPPYARSPFMYVLKNPTTAGDVRVLNLAYFLPLGDWIGSLPADALSGVPGTPLGGGTFMQSSQSSIIGSDLPLSPVIQYPYDVIIRRSGRRWNPKEQLMEHYPVRGSILDPASSNYRLLERQFFEMAPALLGQVRNVYEAAAQKEIETVNGKFVRDVRDEVSRMLGVSISVMRGSAKRKRQAAAEEELRRIEASLGVGE